MRAEAPRCRCGQDRTRDRLAEGAPGAQPAPSWRLWRARGFMRCLHCLHVENPWVSTRSRFREAVWYVDLRPCSSAALVRIDFEGVDPAVAAELKLALLLDVSHPAGRRSKLESTVPLARSLAVIGRWMAHARIASLSHLGEAVGELFLQAMAHAVEQIHLGDLEPAMGDWDPRAPSDVASVPGKAGRLAFNGVRAFASAFIVLDGLGAAMERWGGPRLRGRPFGKDDAVSIAADWASRSEQATERLPDAVLRPLIRDARRMMGVPADDVIRLCRRFLDLVEAGSRPLDAAERLRRFRFRRVPGETQRWRANLTGGRRPLEAIMQLVRTVRDAAVLLQLVGVGNRPGEALGLLGGRMLRLTPVPGDEVERRGFLPRCVTEGPGKGGYLIEALLHGIVFKQSREPRRVTWLLGVRMPGGGDCYALEALLVLERLFAPFRRHAVAEAAELLTLDFEADVGEALVMVPCSVGRVAGSLRASIPRFADLSDIPDREAGRDIRRYRDSAGACIAMYQCRKTWAQLVYRVDSALMPAINTQLQNRDVEDTRRSYVTDDPTFRRELEIETSRLTVMLKRQVMDGRDAGVPTMSAAIDAAIARAGEGVPAAAREEIWRARVTRPDGVFGHGRLRPRAGVPNLFADLAGPTDVSGVTRAEPPLDPHALGRDGPSILRGLVADRRAALADLAAGGVGSGSAARDRAVDAARRLRAMGFDPGGLDGLLEEKDDG